MSTSNFMYSNELFIVPGSDEEHFEEMDAEMVREAIVTDVMQEFVNDESIDVYEFEGYDDERNYPGLVFLKLEYTKHNVPGVLSEDDITIRGRVIMRSGYYSGLNVDYVIDEAEYDNTYEPVPETPELEMVRSRMRAGIENVLHEHCKRAIRLGTFSNGESVYEYA